MRLDIFSEEFQDYDFIKKEDTLEIHPLLIDHVIENVLRHIFKISKIQNKIKEFLSLRLVCHSWYEIGTELLQVLDDSEKTFIGVGIEDTSRSRMERFLETIEQSQLLLPPPFRKFRFESNFLAYHENSLLFEKFLLKMGPVLTHLSLILGESYFSFEKITKYLVGCKLKKLELDLVGSYVRKVDLKELLESQKDSLIDLRFHLEEEDLEKLIYPLMPNLKRFELRCENEINFNNFNCLGSFPKLNKLVLKNLKNKRRSNRLNDSQMGFLEYSENYKLKYPSVQEIELTDEFSSHLLIQRISKAFPNLKKFHLNIARNLEICLKSVFVWMKKLEELNLEFSALFANAAIDSVFTGIAIEKCRAMLDKQSFTPEDVQDGLRSENLTDLKCLKKLRIRGDLYAVVVTDVTANFALMEMPKLKQIEIEGFNISHGMFDKLRKKFHLTKLEKNKRKSK